MEYVDDFNVIFSGLQYTSEAFKIAPNLYL